MTRTAAEVREQRRLQVLEARDATEAAGVMVTTGGVSVGDRRERLSAGVAAVEATSDRRRVSEASFAGEKPMPGVSLSLSIALSLQQRRAPEQKQQD